MCAPAGGYSGQSGRPIDGVKCTRYAGAGVNRNTLVVSNGLIADLTAVGAAALGSAGACIDARATSARLTPRAPSALAWPAAAVDVCRGAFFVTLAAICRSGAMSSMIQNDRPIVAMTRSPW